MITTTTAATKGAKEALNKVLGHWATWVVLGLLALYLGWKAKGGIERWWNNLQRTNRADTDGHSMTAEDVARVKAIAQALRTAIHSWTNSGREVALTQAVALNATELLFLAEEYAAINDGVSLLQDLEDEMTLPDVGQRLIARLNEVGAPKVAGLEPVEQVTIT